MTVPTVPLEVFSAWRARRTGLVGEAAGTQDETGSVSVEDTVARAGWLLAPGSTAPYLSLRIRNPACTREVVDRTVLAERRLVRVTGVRGEPFLVPRDVVLTAVAAKGRRIDARIRQIGKVVSISRGEVETLAMAIAEFLGEGPATLKELEEGLPAGMLRSFGTERRRAGVSGVLPVALEYLEEEGRVLHLDTGKRLDDGKRVYSLIEKALPEVEGPAPDQLEVLPQAFELYLRSYGPARLEDFVWWAGTTLNRTRTAIESLETAPVEVEVEELAGPLAIFPDDLESLLAYEPSDEPDVALIPNRDPFYLGRKVLNREFIDSDSPDRVLARFRGKSVAARVVPTVLVNGRIAGIWEWDAKKKSIDWALFESSDADATPPPGTEAAIEREAEWLTAFILKELDGRIVLDPLERGTHWAYGVEELRSFW
jgi:hypothetical protein